MKKLINALIKELKKVKENPKRPLQRLKSIYEEIGSCGNEYVKLPAYIAYRAVGMYEVNSNRL